MKYRRCVLTIVIAILVIFLAFLAACASETSYSIAMDEEPTVALGLSVTCKSKDDYVWTDTGEDEDWSVRITIPKQLDCVVVDDSKANLSLDEMNALDTSVHTPKNAVINFCVASIGEECTEKTFNPRMLIEIKFDSATNDILLYPDKGKWKAFKEQAKGNGIAWAKIKEWAADPQVAWGR